MVMKTKEKSLLPLYVAYVVPATLANSFLALYLLTHLDVGLTGLLGYYLLAFTVGAAAVFFQGTIGLRTTFTIAAALVATEFIILAFATSFVHTLAAAAAYGLLMMYFWTAYNALHFKKQPPNQNATNSAHYWVVIWTAALALPLVGAAILNAAGFTELYLVAATLSIGLFWKAFGFKKEKIRFNLPRDIRKSHGYRTLTFLEGALTAMPLCILPALSVLYFPTPTEFGIYTAFVALAGIAAAIVLAKASDALNKRKRFLGPLSVATAAALLAALVAQDAWTWAAATAAFSFAYALSSPLRIAVILDKEKRAEVAMGNREFLLNVGRVAALLVSAAAIALGQPQGAIVSGILAAVGYATMLKRNKWVR